MSKRLKEGKKLEGTWVDYFDKLKMAAENNKKNQEKMNSKNQPYKARKTVSKAINKAPEESLPVSKKVHEPKGVPKRKRSTDGDNKDAARKKKMKETHTTTNDNSPVADEFPRNEAAVIPEAENDDSMLVGPTVKIIPLNDKKYKEAAVEALEKNTFVQLDREAVVAELLPHFEQSYTVGVVFDSLVSFCRSEDPVTWQNLIPGRVEGKTELYKFAKIYNRLEGKTNYAETTPSKVVAAFTSRFKKTEIRKILSSLLVKLFYARRGRSCSKLLVGEIQDVLGNNIYTEYIQHCGDSVIKHLWANRITLDQAMKVGFDAALAEDEIRLDGDSEQSEIKKLAISQFGTKDASAIRMKVLLGNRSKQKSIISQTEKVLEEQKLLLERIETEYESLAKEEELDSLLEAAMKNVELIFENDNRLIESFFKFLEDFKSLDYSDVLYKEVLDEIDAELFHQM